MYSQKSFLVVRNLEVVNVNSERGENTNQAKWSRTITDMFGDIGKNSALVFLPNTFGKFRTNASG